MKVGFIGTGSMGSILAESLLRSAALAPEQIILVNRTRQKAVRVAERNLGVQVADTAGEAAERCDVVFLCIKPLEFRSVIDEIRSRLRPAQIVVSITSPVLIRQLEDQLPCKIAKIIPSITNYVNSGASLCMFGSRIEQEDRELLIGWMKAVSEPIEIDEAYTRVTSDISSCGPAFLAFFLDRFIQAAVEETGITPDEATRLACEMTLGTGKLLTEGNLSPAALQERVSVPGGITAEAIRMMDAEFGNVLNRLIRTTHRKYEEDLDKVETMFYGQKVDEWSKS